MNLQPVFFILGFIVILALFIYLIVWVSSRLSGHISRRVYGIVESVIIAGILLGIVGMFQPWTLPGFRWGFLLLLISTLAFIVWSHVTPEGVRRGEDIGSISVMDLERGYSDGVS